MSSVYLLVLRYKYAILFPLACLEGPILAIISGALLHQGVLSLAPIVIIFILGDLIPDSIYYFMGCSLSKRKLSIKAQKFFRISEKRLVFFTKIWGKHAGKAIFLGKLSYGLSIPIIISAGIAKLPYNKFISYTIPTTIFQYTLFISLGYFTAYSYTYLGTYIKYGGIFISLFICVLLGVYFILIRHAEHRIKELEKDDSQINPNS